MKIFNVKKIMLPAIIFAALLLSSCKDDSIEIDYSKSIIGKWVHHSETYVELLNFTADGKVLTNGYMNGETWEATEGTWILEEDHLELVFPADPDKDFSGTINLIEGGTLAITSFKTGKTWNYHYTEVGIPASLHGTWVNTEEGYIEVMQINSSGIVLNIGQSENEKWEKQNGHIRAADHIILLEFSDGYHFVGYYELVAGETLALIDFETGARKVFHCKKTDYSKQIVGNWFGIGEENTFIHSFNADGSMTGMIKSHSAISQDGSKLWNIGDGQYSLLGNILHIKYAKQSYLTTIDIAENTPVNGDVLKMNFLGEEISCTRFNDGLDLTGTEWGYDNLYVSNAGGADKGIDIGSGLSFNPSTMDGKLLKEMVKSQLFKIRFPSEKEMEYQVTIAGNIYTQEIPMSVEGNKVTFHMENVYSNLKNIEVYMFQNMKGSQMHLNMTRDAFVDFIANMYAINVKDSSAAQAKREELNTALTSFNMAMIFEREQ